MGKALYRKYRPKSLSEVAGQSHVTGALEKSLASSKISHAYLFVGPRGTGKTSVARILAHQINDFIYKLESEHLDIIEIDAASNTGVDNIRSLRENAVIAPTHGKYKIYIIDEVHMLSKPAFNALLKTLEEPPAHVVFIMATTDAHKIPVTITSRSQTYTFKLANPNLIATHLASIAKTEKINITDSAIEVIAKRSGGSFRDAISLLDQISTAMSGEITCAMLEDALGLPSDELIGQLLTAYLTGDLTCARNLLQNLLEQGIKPEIIAEDMITVIAADPKPQLLPLLGGLVEVPLSPRPEVKLLLALLSAPPDHQSAQMEALQQNSSKHIVPPVKKPDLPSSENLSENLATKPPSVQTWQSLLDTIKKDNLAFHSLLARANAQYAKNTLAIYIKNKLVRDKIEQKINYIASFLPDGTTVQVADQPASADPVMNDLTSIFGNVEEIPPSDGII